MAARSRADLAVPLLSTPLVAAGLCVGVIAVSTSALLVRLAEAPALAISFWRCLLGAACLAPFAWRAQRTRPALARWELSRLLLAGVALALHFALWLASLSFTTVASSVTLVAMAPLFVGLGAAVFLREPPAARTWRGIFLALAGAVVIAGADLVGAPLGGRALFGDALAFGGAAAVSGYLLIGRALRRRMPVVVYGTLVYGIAATVLLVVCVVTGTDLGVSSPTYDAGTWWAIAGIVIGPQLLGHTLFNTLLSTVTATVVAVTVLAEPVVASLLAFAVLAELPAPLFWLGAPLVLAGVGLVAAHPRRGQPR